MKPMPIDCDANKHLLPTPSTQFDLNHPLAVMGMEPVLAVGYRTTGKLLE